MIDLGDNLSNILISRWENKGPNGDGQNSTFSVLFCALSLMAFRYARADLKVGFGSQSWWCLAVVRTYSRPWSVFKYAHGVWIFLVGSWDWESSRSGSVVCIPAKASGCWTALVQATSPRISSFKNIGAPVVLNTLQEAVRDIKVRIGLCPKVFYVFWTDKLLTPIICVCLWQGLGIFWQLMERSWWSCWLDVSWN